MKKRIFSILFISTIILLAFTANSFSFNWDTLLRRMEMIRFPRFDRREFLYSIGGKNNTQENFTHNTKILYKSLLSTDLQVKAKTIIVISKLGFKNFKITFLSMLKTEKNSFLKRLIIWGLGCIGSNKDVLALIQYSHNVREPVILNSLSLAIGKIARRGGNAQPLEYLLKNSNNLMVKCSSILSLGKIKSRSSIALLIKYSKSDISEIRFCSLVSLAHILKKEDNYKMYLFKLVDNETSNYVLAAIYYAILKSEGFHKGVYKRLIGMLHIRGASRAAVDFLVDLPFAKSFAYLRIALNRTSSIYIQRRIHYIIAKLRTKSSYISLGQS